MNTDPQATIQRKEVGAPPATLMHVGERHAGDFYIQVTCYNEKVLETSRFSSAAELPDYPDDRRVWIQVVGLHEAAEIGELCKRFEVHPLVAEDILNTEGLAKSEDLEDYLFTSLKVPAGEGVEFELRQVSLLLSRSTLITFVEEESALFSPLHRRLTVEGSRIRLRGYDYLAWAILDVISDTSLALIDRLEDRLEEIEEQISIGDQLPDLMEVHRTRRKVAKVYRVVRPFRDIANMFNHSDSPLLTEDSAVYFGDLYDHGIQAVDLSEFLREHASSLRELYFTTTSHRMNEVMKILASISAIFLPLTFLAGMYGMNFDVMPELHWKWGYPALLLIFVSLGLFLVRLFRKKGWL